MARVTSRGVRSVTLTEYLTILSDEVSRALGSNLAFDPETPQGQIVGVLGQVFAEVDQSIVATANGLDIHSAIGFQLDALASVFGIERLDARRSTGFVTFFGRPGTLIPVGTIVTDATGNVRARVIPPTSARINPSGDVTVLAEHSVPGPNQIPARTLSRMQSPIAGILGLTNVAPFLPGRNRESDVEFRERYFRSIGQLARGTTDVLVSGIINVNGIRTLRLEQNRTPAPILLQGVEIGGHSILAIVVDDGNVPDNRRSPQRPIDPGVEAAIIQAISTSLPAGIGTSGNTAQVDVRNQEIRYERANPVRIGVNIRLNLTSAFPSDGLSRIRSAITQYIDSLSIGGGIPESQLYLPLYSVPGHNVTDDPLVQRYDVNVAFQGIDGGQPHGFTDIDVDRGFIYVLDDATSRVYIYNAIGNAEGNFELHPDNSSARAIAIRPALAPAAETGFIYVANYDESDDDRQKVYAYRLHDDPDTQNPIYARGDRVESHELPINENNSRPSAMSYSVDNLYIVDSFLEGETNRLPDSDIEITDTDITDPHGLSMSSTRIYISNIAQPRSRIYAYNRANNNRVNAESFQIDASNTNPWGMHLVGDHLYVTQDEDEASVLYLYDITNPTATPSTINLNPDTTNQDCTDPQGVWVNASEDKFYVSQDRELDSQLLAYTLSSTTATRDRDNDIDLPFTPWGVWSDGSTVYTVVSESTGAKIYAYDISVSPPVRDQGKEFPLDIENIDPRDITVEDGIMYVLQNVAGELSVYAYLLFEPKIYQYGPATRPDSGTGVYDATATPSSETFPNPVTPIGTTDTENHDRHYRSYVDNENIYIVRPDGTGVRQYSRIRQAWLSLDDQLPLTAVNSQPRNIAYANSKMYVIDESGDENPDRVYIYDYEQKRWLGASDIVDNDLKIFDLKLSEYLYLDPEDINIITVGLGD